MESVPCDLCGSARHEALFEQGDLLHKTTVERFRLVRCLDCGLRYQSPRPSAAEMGRYYAGAYAFHQKQGALKNAARLWARRLVAAAYLGAVPAPLGLLARLVLLPLRLTPLGGRLVTQLIPPVPSFLEGLAPGRLVDVGCGSGEHVHVYGPGVSLAALAARGWTVFGVEPSEGARKVLASCGAAGVYPDLAEAGLPEASVDVVRLNWSLEHAPSPMATLRECRRLLKPGGRLIVAVPNYEGLTYRLFPTCVEFPVHTYYFCPATMRRYAEVLGLEVSGSVTFSYAALFLTALELMGRGAEAAGYRRSLDASARLQEALTLAGRLGFGDDMVFCLTRR